MKKILLLLLLLLTISHTNAQGIVGKWRCTHEFLQDLGLRYENMQGYYVFKKNGKFTVKISGNNKITNARRYDYFNGKEYTMYAKHANFRIMSVKAKGRYKIVDGRITTYVKSNSAKCYVSPGYEQPEINGTEGVYAQLELWGLDTNYSSASVMADFQEKTIKKEKRGLWTWTNASLHFHGDTLTVGKFIRMVRK